MSDPDKPGHKRPPADPVPKAPPPDPKASLRPLPAGPHAPDGSPRAAARRPSPLTVAAPGTRSAPQPGRVTPARPPIVPAPGALRSGAGSPGTVAAAPIAAAGTRAAHHVTPAADATRPPHGPRDDRPWPSALSVGVIPPAIADIAAIRGLVASEDMPWRPVADDDVLPRLADDDQLVPLALDERPPLPPQPAASAADNAGALPVASAPGVAPPAFAPARLAVISAGIVVLVVGVCAGPAYWWLFHRVDVPMVAERTSAPATQPAAGLRPASDLSRPPTTLAPRTDESAGHTMPTPATPAVAIAPPLAPAQAAAITASQPVLLPAEEPRLPAEEPRLPPGSEPSGSVTSAASSSAAALVPSVDSAPAAVVAADPPALPAVDPPSPPLSRAFAGYAAPTASPSAATTVPVAPPDAVTASTPTPLAAEELSPSQRSAFAGRAAPTVSPAAAATTPVASAPAATATASLPDLHVAKMPPLALGSAFVGRAAPAASPTLAATTPTVAPAPAAAALPDPPAAGEPPRAPGGEFLVAQAATPADSPAAAQPEPRLDRALTLLALGAMYQAPDGRSRDPVKALGWYQIALQLEQQQMPHGSPLVHVLGERIATLRKELTPEARTRANRHAAEELAVLGIKPGEPAVSQMASPTVGALVQQAAAVPQAAVPQTPNAPTKQTREPPVKDPPDGWPAKRKDQIEVLQKLLAEAGLYTAVIDGKMGPHTRSAIREAEKRAGLPQTGQPSADLYDALRQQATRTPAGRATTQPVQEESVAGVPVPEAAAQAAPTPGRRGSLPPARGTKTSSGNCAVAWGWRWCWPWLASRR